MAINYWTYLVTYDLRSPGRNYDELYKGIKSIANGYSRVLESVWIIRAPMSEDGLVAALQAYVDYNDRIFVTELKANAWAEHNLPDSTVDWLKKYVV